MCGPEDTLLELPEGVKFKEGSIASKLFDTMRDGSWYTVGDLSDFTGVTASRIPARLREFRKRGFDVQVEKYEGTFEYRLALA